MGVSEFTGRQVGQVLCTCIKCYEVSVPLYSVYLRAGVRALDKPYLSFKLTLSSVSGEAREGPYFNLLRKTLLDLSIGPLWGFANRSKFRR